MAFEAALDISECDGSLFSILGQQIEAQLRVENFLFQRFERQQAGSLLLQLGDPLLAALARRLDHPARVVDVGSGGGLPAIPLALLRAELTVALVEPIAKKAAFLRTAIRELEIGDRVSVRVTRGEALAQTIVADPGSAFDVAISRATLAPQKWLALGARLVRPGGRVFALATADALPELGDRDVYFEGRRALIQVGA